MPFCDVGNDGVRIFYRTYGGGPVKVLLIIGLAATHEGWGPQIRGLAGTDRPNDGELDDVGRTSVGAYGEGGCGGGGGIEVCALDNRGIGRSSIPAKKSDYSTEIMAKDAIAVLDHLEWRRAHIFGHSMGAMIACKLAAMVPKRVNSLALLNVTGGGFECFPRIDRQSMWIAFRFLRAKTPEDRAAVDLDTHYTKEYLEESVGADTRRVVLHREYVKGICSSGMQSSCGFDGQISACWNHKLSKTEIEKIRSAGFLVSVIHGRHDVIAQIHHAKRLAEKLHPVARMVDLHGGHLVSHERTEEVNQALLELIRASEANTSPHEWTDTSPRITEPLMMGSRATDTMMMTDRESNNGSSRISDNNMCVKYCIDRVNLIIWYFAGLFVLVFDYGRKAVTRSLMPSTSLKLQQIQPALTTLFVFWLTWFKHRALPRIIRRDVSIFLGRQQ